MGREKPQAEELSPEEREFRELQNKVVELGLGLEKIDGRKVLVCAELGSVSILNLLTIIDLVFPGKRDRLSLKAAGKFGGFEIWDPD